MFLNGAGWYCNCTSEAPEKEDGVVELQANLIKLSPVRTSFTRRAYQIFETRYAFLSSHVTMGKMGNGE
jgi:hypothetical protein